MQEFAQDTSKGKGEWVKCVNSLAADELKSHTSMFSPQRNPHYHVMLPRARDQITRWIDKGWYESAEPESGADEKTAEQEVEEIISMDVETEAPGP